MGALPNRATKFSTLFAEVNRRLRNTSQEVDISTKANIISRFSKAMESSGYQVMARAEAIWASINGHNRAVANEKEESLWRLTRPGQQEAEGKSES